MQTVLTNIFKAKNLLEMKHRNYYALNMIFQFSIRFRFGVYFQSWRFCILTMTKNHFQS